MEKEILLVNDLCGVGKVALSVMIPLLSAQGHIVHNLPTASYTALATCSRPPVQSPAA